MNTIKSLGLAGLATAALFAGQVFATPVVCPAGTQGSPVCVATAGSDGAGSSLQEQLDARTVSGSNIDVYNDQWTPSSYWKIGATGASENVLVLETAGSTNGNAFGIYDPANPANFLQLFGGATSGGAHATLVDNGGGSFSTAPFGGSITTAQFGAGSLFGYYLSTPDGVFYSDPSLNAAGGALYPNGMHHMVAYQGTGETTLKMGARTGLFLSNEFILAWEGQAWESDLDYNDFIVMVESVHSVPEPAVLGMFGLGALLIGLFAGLRRRQEAA
jgi:hypothetical protein